MIRRAALTAYFVLFSFCFIVKHVLDNYYLPVFMQGGKNSAAQLKYKNALSVLKQREISFKLNSSLKSTADKSLSK